MGRDEPSPKDSSSKCLKLRGLATDGWIVTVAARLQKMLRRPSDDRTLGTDSAVVEIAEIEFRPDLLIRWDDETVPAGSPLCSRGPGHRATPVLAGWPSPTAPRR